MGTASQGHLAPRAMLPLALLLLAAVSARAAVLLVPESYTTIQAAVDAAASTDTVSVAAGTYTGPGNRDISIIGKSLLLQSRAGRDQTIIDCEHLGQAFSLDGWGATPVIDGFSMIHGNGAEGGALLSGLASPVIRRCRFESNESHLGGAVFLGYTATFEECEFLGNRDNSGGGAVFALQGYPVFIRCVFAGNESNGPGGAVRTDAASLLTFTDCTIVGNGSSWSGGGIFSFDAPVTLVRTICRDNCGGEFPSEISVGTRVLTLNCSDVDMAGVEAAQIMQENLIDADPLFCDPRPCYQGAEAGDYSLRSDSPCLPGGNPCSATIGALGAGCSAPGTGACCRTDGTCIIIGVSACEAMQGRYVGDGTPCEPDPCQPTPTQRVSWGRIKAAFR